MRNQLSSKARGCLPWYRRLPLHMGAWFGSWEGWCGGWKTPGVVGRYKPGCVPWVWVLGKAPCAGARSPLHLHLNVLFSSTHWCLWKPATCPTGKVHRVPSNYRPLQFDKKILLGTWHFKSHLGPARMRDAERNPAQAKACYG